MNRHNEKLTLDVGCGNKPRGDINVDLHRFSGDIVDGRILRTRADVIASGEYLPFADRVFHTVLSSNTIEHVPKPALFLRELIRVSRNYINIRVPHRFSRFARRKGHKNQFDRKWFALQLANLGIDEDMTRIRPHFASLFNLPVGLSRVREIEVEIFVERVKNES